MAETTGIEWTDSTFNPWRGCSKVHAGCANCYAETLSGRNPGTLGIWGPNGTRVVASEAMWRQPVKWNAQAEADGVRRRVFCASLADVFEDWNRPLKGSGGGYLHQGKAWHAVTPYVESEISIGKSIVRLDDVRARLFALIDATPHLDWLLLTKRPENVRRMWPAFELGRWDSTGRELPLNQHRKNVWLGTSVSLQEHVDRQVPELLKCRDLAANLFLSIEPLLGPIVLHPHIDASGNFNNSQGINVDWVIVGGESGNHARPMHPAWVRSLRDQCTAAGVPFFFKQWGEWAPWSGSGMNAASRVAFARLDGTITETQNDGMSIAMPRVGKKDAGRLLDGRAWSEFPKGGAA